MGINRYPGPKPFRTEEESIFFGRDTDIAEFYKYIFLHQIVILFGESGYGKSSLINAGIVPLLKTKNPNTISFEIKFGPYVPDRNTPLQKVKEIITEKLAQSAPSLIESYLESDRSLWYYLKNFQLIYETHQIVFFFDQFEELFTYPADQILDFKRELADVLYSTVPEFYRNQEEKLDAEGVSEEFRMTFYQKPDVKIVFAIRSDRLGLLEDMKDFHPSVLKNCYELKAFDSASALEAIHKPAALPDIPKGTFKTVPFKIEDSLSRAIVNSLKDKKERIQPSTLQIICWQMEDKFVPLVEESKDIDETTAPFELTFDEFDLNKDGNLKEEIASIFENYYRTAIETKVPESLQNAAFLLVEKVFVQSGQRIPFEKEYLLSEFLMKQFKIVDRADSQTILDTLTDASLLKVERDSQGRMMYELGHDTLVEPISRAANLRREKEEQQRLLEEAEAARETAQKAKAEEEKAKQQAEDFRKLKEAAEVAKDEAESYARKASLRSIVAIFISVIALTVAGFAIYFKRQADAATINAGKSKVAADRSRNEAQQRLMAFFELQAKGYVEKGDELFERQAYQAALDYYREASKLRYRDATLKKELEGKMEECKKFLNL